MRVRLAATGFVAIYVPVLVLLGVSSVTSTNEQIIGPDGSIDVFIDDSPSTPWTAITAILLAPVAAGLSWWWAGRATTPIDRIRSVAETVEAGALDQRINMADGPTELVSLADSFDGMLDRLAEAAAIQTDLLDEASHELRTPLTILQTNAEVLLSDPEPSVELYREGLERSRATASRMSELVRSLLIEAQSRRRIIDRRPTDVAELARVAVDDAAPVAAAADVELVVGGAERAVARVDPVAVERAITILLSNAIRHAPAGSAVDVVVVADDEAECAVEITNAGEAIAAELHERIFERGHAGPGGGAGLGLTIAKHIAEAHGGDVEVTSPVDAKGGARFRLRLPR